MAGAPIGRETSSATQGLRQGYRLHTLQAVLHEREIERVFTVLRSSGVNPLLAKGWAVARLYPEEGLRPYGDIDLFVRPEHHSAALAALKSSDVLPAPVDLHRGFLELDDRSPEELYARAQQAKLGGVEVTFPGPEDHLRLLCLHMLRHGAVRPLWLSDIGAVLESRPAEFDWDYFLSGNRRRTDYIIGALGLAHELLGARLDDTPVADRARGLPRWLVSTVLRQWGAGFRRREPMMAYLRGPAGVLQELCHHWPNSIEATIGVNGPFNELPRLPFQVAHSLVRTLQFAARTPSLLWRQWRNP